MRRPGASKRSSRADAPSSMFRYVRAVRGRRTEADMDPDPAGFIRIASTSARTALRSRNPNSRRASRARSSACSDAPFPNSWRAPRTPQPQNGPAPGSRGYRDIRSNTKTIGRREGLQEHGRGTFLQFRRRHYADRQLPSPVGVPSRSFLPCIRWGVGAFRHKVLRNPQKLSTGRRRRAIRRV